ncbi:MAG: hypothetical protein FD123_389 [Bacteroidetes bacterium]|nr:MAG: hypothetical protein FD123_389 [Bacteroidota bacterium]
MNVFHFIRIRKEVLARMKVMQIKDFSDTELDRVFGGVQHSTGLIRHARMLVKDGLTIDDLYGKSHNR